MPEGTFYIFPGLPNPVFGKTAIAETPKNLGFVAGDRASEAQHPKSSAIHKLAGYPIFRE
jgi:hypothetical protein